MSPFHYLSNVIRPNYLRQRPRILSELLAVCSWVSPLLGRLARHGVVGPAGEVPTLRDGSLRTCLWEVWGHEHLLRGVAYGATALPSDSQIDEPDGERKEQQDDQRPGAP